MGAGRLLFGNPRFLLVWMVGGFTGVVRWLQLLALGLHTYEITGSPLLVSTVPMLWMLPLALCGPFVGVVADRANRKLLLVASLVTVLAVCLAMVLASSTGSVPAIPGSSPPRCSAESTGRRTCRCAGACSATSRTGTSPRR